MAKKIQTWLAVGVIGIGLVAAGIAGCLVWVTNTPPLHPNPEAVPSVTDSTPAAQWATAVEQGRQIARAGLVEQNLPGLSVAVGAGGDIVWAEGFGYADLEERVPVKPSTRFRIGTASTALTSAAVGLLVEQGRLNLDDKIQTYVPEFPQKPWPVTVRQLMAHTAGIRNDGGDEGELLGKRCERPVEGLQAFASSDLRFEPGTDFRFSSYGWILMSAAVEAAADEPFLMFMRKRVFEPLGMNDTEAESATDSIPNRSTFYFPRFAAEPRYGPDVNRPIDYSCYAGSSVFLSTASDLVRFNLGVNSGKLLQPATVQMLQAPQKLVGGQDTGYALGWDLETIELAGENKERIVTHGTSMGGILSTFISIPERGLVVSVISNIPYADTAAIAVKIARAFAEQGKGAAW